MYSWVRYSVAVYLGLLLAGSIVMPPSASIGSGYGPDDGAALLPTITAAEPAPLARPAAPTGRPPTDWCDRPHCLRP